MKKVIIFGMGSTGKQVYESVKNTMEVVGFCDNEPAKKGTEFEGVTCIGNAGTLAKWGGAIGMMA